MLGLSYLLAYFQVIGVNGVLVLEAIYSRQISNSWQ